MYVGGTYFQHIKHSKRIRLYTNRNIINLHVTFDNKIIDSNQSNFLFYFMWDWFHVDSKSAQGMGSYFIIFLIGILIGVWLYEDQWENTINTCFEGIGLYFQIIFNYSTLNTEHIWEVLNIVKEYGLVMWVQKLYFSLWNNLI